MDQKQVAVGCEECEFRGWLHVRQPFEIQRCDTCAREISDEIATQSHQRDCGCDWPAVDYQDLLRRRSFFGNDKNLPTQLRELVGKFHELASQRYLFHVNIYSLASLLGEALQFYHNNWTVLENVPSIYKELESLATYLVIVTALVQRKNWKPHWLWFPEDGTMINGKWYAKKGVPPFQSKFSRVTSVNISPKEIENVRGLIAELHKLGVHPVLLHDEIQVNTDNLSPEIRIKVAGIMKEFLDNYTKEIIARTEAEVKLNRKRDPLEDLTWEELAQKGDQL